MLACSDVTFRERLQERYTLDRYSHSARPACSQSDHTKTAISTLEETQRSTCRSSGLRKTTCHLGQGREGGRAARKAVVPSWQPSGFVMPIGRASRPLILSSRCMIDSVLVFSTTLTRRVAFSDKCHLVQRRMWGMRRGVWPGNRKSRA